MSVTYHWRRGGDWDVEAEQETVDEYCTDPFLLWILRAIQAGKVACGGCQKPFAGTREVALITEWIAFDPKPDVQTIAYCLTCAEKHADELADPLPKTRQGRLS
jgi:hypothetical protein